MHKILSDFQANYDNYDLWVMAFHLFKVFLIIRLFYSYYTIHCSENTYNEPNCDWISALNLVKDVKGYHTVLMPCTRYTT